MVGDDVGMNTGYSSVLQQNLESTQILFRSHFYRNVLFISIFSVIAVDNAYYTQCLNFTSYWVEYVMCVTTVIMILEAFSSLNIGPSGVRVLPLAIAGTIQRISSLSFFLFLGVFTFLPFPWTIGILCRQMG